MGAASRHPSFQFDSRLLRNLMPHTGNQVLLGTFVYVLPVPQTTSEVEGRRFVRQLSATIVSPPVPCTFPVRGTSDPIRTNHQRGVYETNEEHVVRSP